MAARISYGPTREPGTRAKGAAIIRAAGLSASSGAKSRISKNAHRVQICRAVIPRTAVHRSRQQPIPIAPTETQEGAIVEPDDEVALWQRPDLLDPVEIHD